MEQIDTLSFGCLLTENEDKEQIIRNIKAKTKKITEQDEKGNISYYYVGGYNKYSFWFNEQYCCLLITLQHRLIANKTETAIIEETTKAVTEYFGLTDKQLKIQKLNRIDYKQDYKIKNEEELEIIKFLLEKAVDKISKNYIKEVSNKDGFYKAKYTSNGSGFVEITFYDKGAEMLKLAKKGKITLAVANKYKGTFRTEIRIKNKRLNYEKYKNGTSKDIYNYYDKLVAKMYFDNYIAKILGKERFYRIDIAKELIKKAQTLKNNMKEKLCNLLEKINKNGFTKARDSYNNTKTFYEHLKRIRQLGINFLTFGSKLNEKKVTAESIDNFSVMEDTEITTTNVKY